MYLFQVNIWSHIVSIPTCLQTNDWEDVERLKNCIAEKGWFKRAPKNSVLRKDPACAWLSAGMTEIDQRSKFLPALHKDVLRKALKAWIELHFFLPVAGISPKDDKHVNMMHHFVTFVWGYYTLHHCPIIPAFTDVGRFIFTYIWRNQHPLLRYFPNEL